MFPEKYAAGVLTVLKNTLVWNTSASLPVEGIPNGISPEKRLGKKQVE
jgi:hypothetical protein